MKQAQLKIPLGKILILQTAFLGDVILTLPLVQILHRKFPEAKIDFVTTPRAAEILRGHRDIHSVLVYNKRKTQRGIRGMIAMSRSLKKTGYDIAIVPHRSLRSALVVYWSKIPERIAFSTSAGKWLFTKKVQCKKELHEVERNLEFLSALGIKHSDKELPSLYPSTEDVAAVDRYFFEEKIVRRKAVIGIAPGSVWNTKRWLPERFSELCRMLSGKGIEIVLIGGKEDEELCNEIKKAAETENVHSAAGKFSILQSAELIRRCDLLISNDSAPLHLAVAMRTPVVAIFGATSPAFGFAPYGKRDVIVERNDLDCRPCSIHGSDKCPIGTFDCMVGISAKRVFEEVEEIVGKN
jgi:heptosyltransferase-2